MSLMKFSTIAFAVLGLQLPANAQSPPTRTTATTTAAAAAKKADTAAKERINAWTVGIAGGLIEGAMRGGLSTAQIVIVHRRKIIVHQRVGMDQFHRGGRRVQHLRRDVQCFTGEINQQWPQALAAAEHRVALRGVQALRNHVGVGQHIMQDGMDARLVLAHAARQRFLLSRIWIRRE